MNPASFLHKKEIAFYTLHCTVSYACLSTEKFDLCDFRCFLRRNSIYKILNAKKEKKHSGYFTPFPDPCQSSMEGKHHVLENPSDLPNCHFEIWMQGMKGVFKTTWFPFFSPPSHICLQTEEALDEKKMYSREPAGGTFGGSSTQAPPARFRVT